MRISTLVAGALLMLAAPAWAQGDPSADQIIQSLKPKGGVLGGTRGIRAAAPQAAPEQGAAPAAKPAVVAAHTAPDAAPSVNLTVQFATGSSELTPAAVRTLNELGKALSSPALANYHFRIEGHTDTVGQHDRNVALSQQRAGKVAEYLSSKFGVSASRLEAVGRGPDALLVPTPDQTPEPRNRRVQVINIGA
jgi:outer membrane protein OmpA-like peptidoglycan-associated protein